MKPLSAISLECVVSALSDRIASLESELVEARADRDSAERDARDALHRASLLSIELSAERDRSRRAESVAIRNRESFKTLADLLALNDESNVVQRLLSHGIKPSDSRKIKAIMVIRCWRELFGKGDSGLKETKAYVEANFFF